MTPEQRSHCMSRIKGNNTGPELRLRKALWAAGLRYRLKNDLPGKPDLVFVSTRLAVFVDGCFWHKCPLHGTKPAANRDFWKEKLERNVTRDREVDFRLRELGWKVYRCWEHDVNDNLDRVVKEIRALLEADSAKKPQRRHAGKHAQAHAV